MEPCVSTNIVRRILRFGMDPGFQTRFFLKQETLVASYYSNKLSQLIFGFPSPLPEPLSILTRPCS
jgi:hypothetical protein